MFYKFDAFKQKRLWSHSKILFVVGKHPFFVNLLTDMIISKCKDVRKKDDPLGLYEEFKVTAQALDSKVSFDQFLENVATTSLLGRWICITRLESMNKSNTKRLDDYLKTSGSKQGILIVISTDYNNYKHYLHDRVFDLRGVNLVSLSFPEPDDLHHLIDNKLSSFGLRTSSLVIQLMINRMSIAYERYPKIFDRIASNLDNYNGVLSYKDMQDALKDEESHVIDDFLLILANAFNTNKISKRRRIYSIFQSLVENYGSKQLVNSLTLKVSKCLQYRENINNGNIPIMVPYDISKAKMRIDNGYTIKTNNDITFKKTALLASKLSANDWIHIYSLLVDIRKGDLEKLYAVMHRYVLDIDILANKNIYEGVGIFHAH